MKVPPKMALTRVMKGKQGDVWEKACVSIMVITSFFIGSLGGIVSFKPNLDTVFWPYASEMNTN